MSRHCAKLLPMVVVNEVKTKWPKTLHLANDSTKARTHFWALLSYPYRPHPEIRQAAYCIYSKTYPSGKRLPHSSVLKLHL
jgi:hypothetical protein